MQASRWVSTRTTAALVVLGACAPPAAAHRPHVAVVVSGDEREAGAVRAVLERARDLPATLRVEAPPNAPLSPSGSCADVTAQLAAARGYYVDADFGHCIDAIARDALAPELLAAGHRDEAARVLFWRVACRVGSRDAPEAERTARQFAVLGLDVPRDVDAAAPEVEAALARAQHEVASQQRVALHVRATVNPAAVSLDGRAGVCVTPCAVDVAPGDHVLRVEAEGRVPAWRQIRADGRELEVSLDMAPADPELARQQWTARYAATPAALDSFSSLRLLSRAVRARTLVLIIVHNESRHARLTGALFASGAVRARAGRVTREDRIGDDSPGLLRELLERGGVAQARPLYANPFFWIALGGTAVLAAVITGAAVYTPDTQTVLGFGGGR